MSGCHRGESAIHHADAVLMRARQPRHGRGRRVARWALRALVKTFLVVTIVSVTFNAVVRPPQTLSAPDGQDLRVDGGRVHYRVWGDHGSPIVLVHGFAESTVSWALSAPELAKDHIVYAIDLPGAGYSPLAGRESLDAQAKAVRGFIAALHLHRPALVGHSLGAAVVGRVALDAPGTISGIIFADGDAMPFEGRADDPSPALGAVMRLPHFTTLYRLGTHWDAPARRIFDDQCGSVCRGLEGAKGDALVTAWMRPLRQRAAEDSLRAMARHAMVHLSPAQARAITIPKAIIWGEEDATSGGSLDVARSNFADAPTRIIPHAGHLVMVADPVGFARAVDDLVDGFATR